MDTFTEMLNLIQDFEILVGDAPVSLDTEKDHVDPDPIAQVFGHHSPPFFLQLHWSLGTAIPRGVNQHALLLPIMIMACQVEI